LVDKAGLHLQTKTALSQLTPPSELASDSSSVKWVRWLNPYLTHRFCRKIKQTNKAHKDRKIDFNHIFRGKYCVLYLLSATRFCKIELQQIWVASKKE
jgi:hypothetical protein